jgi:hypothetical protein
MVFVVAHVFADDAAARIDHRHFPDLEPLRRDFVGIAVDHEIRLLHALRRDCPDQRAERAENERRIAFARELSVNAVNNLEVYPERSILLAQGPRVEAEDIASALLQGAVLIERENAAEIHIGEARPHRHVLQRRRVPKTAR